MTSGYPYDGKVSIRINKAKNIRTLMLRVPGEGRYEAISATDSKGRQTGWKKGTLVERTFDMKPRLVEANPLVEENIGADLWRHVLQVLLLGMDAWCAPLVGVVVAAVFVFLENVGPLTVEGLSQMF